MGKGEGGSERDSDARAHFFFFFQTQLAKVERAWADLLMGRGSDRLGGFEEEVASLYQHVYGRGFDNVAHLSECTGNGCLSRPHTHQ